MSNTDLHEYLHETKAKVEPYIFSFLPKTHAHPDIQQCYEMMLDYPLREGKGLRPTICLLMCEAFGGDADTALNTAAALELLQNWLLIHDDIEDGSDLRRGEPCLHRKFGVPMAINIGDALHCKMWEMLHMNKDILGYELAFRILSEFTHLSNEVVEGQHIELSWVKNQRWNLTEDDYWTMCVKKTASYTVITPCRLGAIIANASVPQIQPFYDIGKALGVAFQIQDDALNLIGEEGQYGKEIGGDIGEGKRTLALIHLLNACTKVESRRVVEIMNKQREEKQPSEIQEVLGLMEKYGSIQYIQQRSRVLAQQAYTRFEQAFDDLPVSRAKSVFCELMDFVIEREY